MKHVLVPYKLLNDKLHDHSKDLEGTTGILQEDLLVAITDLYQKHNGKYGDAEIKNTAEIVFHNTRAWERLGSADPESVLAELIESLEMVSEYMSRVLVSKPKNEVWVFLQFHKDYIIMQRMSDDGGE